jgi:hypothetical protein
MWPINCPETSVNNISGVNNTEKSDDLIYTVAETWNLAIK